MVQRQAIVTELRRCTHCQLLFRAPTTSAAEAHRYYQHDYQIGFTTEMPRPAELAELKQSHFRGTGKDYSEYLHILQTVGVPPGGRLLDYGCSWGYGSWQLAQAGYRVTSFEISDPRRQYAIDHLGVDATGSLDQINGQFDVIFSSHVIEHLPNVLEYLAWARSRLVPGGLLVTLCPNGCLPRRQKNSSEYRQAWGLDHPNLLDDVFFQAALPAVPLLLTTSPYPRQLGDWNRKTRLTLDLSGAELLVVALIPG